MEGTAEPFSKLKLYRKPKGNVGQKHMSLCFTFLLSGSPRLKRQIRTYRKAKSGAGMDDTKAKTSNTSASRHPNCSNPRFVAEPKYPRAFHALFHHTAASISKKKENVAADCDLLDLPPHPYQTCGFRSDSDVLPVVRDVEIPVLEQRRHRAILDSLQHAGEERFALFHFFRARQAVFRRDDEGCFDGVRVLVETQRRWDATRCPTKQQRATKNKRDDDCFELGEVLSPRITTTGGATSSPPIQKSSERSKSLVLLLPLSPAWLIRTRLGSTPTDETQQAGRPSLMQQQERCG